MFTENDNMTQDGCHDNKMAVSVVLYMRYTWALALSKERTTQGVKQLVGT